MGPPLAFFSICQMLLVLHRDDLGKMEPSGAGSRVERERLLQTNTPTCWKAPAAALAAPFDANMASLVWTRPLQTPFGPLDDVSPMRRAREWPTARRDQLIEQLPEFEAMRALRYKTCAVVGSSPEVPSEWARACVIVA